MNLAEALIVAVASAALSSALTGCIAIIHMKIELAKLRSTVVENVQFRLLTLENDVKQLQNASERS